MLCRHARNCLRECTLGSLSCVAHSCRVFALDQRSSSTSSREQGNETSEQVIRSSVPFGPGVRLEMHAKSPCHMDIAIGNLEHITVEIRAQNVLQRFKVHSGMDGIKVSEGTANGGPAMISAWIPARFCSVDVSTQRAPISIEGITEASLRAYSYGGDINVGSLKSIEAIADTGGGILEGTVTAKDVRINTAGGKLRLKRLVGVEVEVLTGPSSIDVCYCDNLSLDTGGADVSIGHMNCNGPSAIVQSHGGSINIGGMDGAGSLLSQGGSIDVQITEKARSVQLLSGGGNITAQLVPGLAASLDITAESGIHTSPGLVIGGSDNEQQKPTMMRGQKAAEVAANDASSLRSLPVVAQVRIDAGAGAVTLSKKSWMSAITEKLQAMK